MEDAWRRPGEIMSRGEMESFSLSYEDAQDKVVDSENQGELTNASLPGDGH